MGSARFIVITPECVRMEHSPTGEFVDAPSLFATNRGRELSRHVVNDGDAACEFNTGRMVVRYEPDGRGLSAASLLVRIGDVEWRPGAVNAGNLGGTLETLDRVRGPVPLPDGVLSRDGWYVFDDSRTHLLIDDWATPRPGGVKANTDWYFFGYGKDYRAAMKALAAVAGAAPMPRRYTLGSWYSRYWPYTSAEYREIVGEFDRRGYPIDVIVMDMDWHKPGWTGWSWNRQLLPDAEELLEWFHANGLAVTLNLHPADGVGPHEDQYDAFMRAIGRDPSTKETVRFDAGDRTYAEALFGCVHEPLEVGAELPGTVGEHKNTHGVDFWWLDWQQEKFTPSIPDLTNLWWLNYLYFQHTSRDGMRGCSFSRWAGWGDHRHPVHFSGDAHTGWESLAFQVPFTAVAGNVGCFYWSHDIGGHFGPRLEEATTRWVQFGALSPVLRLHSARSGALNRLPWTYKQQFERAMHAAFRLRSELFPYIYTAARSCHTDMVGLCRPMYIDWPDEESAYENPQQYMFGDHLLVAPITSPGVGGKKVATQAVWFPPPDTSREEGDDAGGHWYNWFTGERYDAGSEQLVAAEIDEIPMFVRAGVPIVTRKPTLRMATAPLDTLVVVCYPGEPGAVHEVELYEDDGISDAHERAEFAVTPVRIRWLNGEVNVEVGPRRGEHAGMVAAREITLEIRGVQSAGAATANGRQSPVVFDSARGRASVTAGECSASEPSRFTVSYVVRDAAAVSEDHRRRRATGLTLTPQTPNAERAILRGVLDGAGIRRVGSTMSIYGMEVRSMSLVDIVGGVPSPARTIAVPPDARACLRADLSQAPPLKTPPLGLSARREAAIVHGRDTTPATDRFLLEARTPHLLGFRILGPYRYDPTIPMGVQQHGPQLLSAGQRLKSMYIDMHARPVTWSEAPPAEYWPQSIRKICGGHNGEAMAYALTHVWSPEEQEVTLLLESGDRMELWLGEDKIFTSDDEAEVESAVEEVRATLKKGWNQFLAKTNEGGGGWGFRVSIDGRFELTESFFGGETVDE